jgi:gliding motility-associated-like protein
MPLTRYIAALLFLFPSVLLGQNDNFQFQENKGQWPSQVQYRIVIDGAQLFIENNAFHYQIIQFPDNHGKKDNTNNEDSLIIGHNFRAEFINSNPKPKFETGEKSSSYHNYFLGDDKSKWANKVHNFETVKYQELYPKIDLLFYQFEGFYKYDYIVKAGANPSNIEVKYKGIKQPKLKDGNLIINHKLGKLIEEKPYSYQIFNGKKVEVLCNYAFNEAGSLIFEFPNGYNKNLELIIDPTLIFSTYSGSSSGNFGMTATYDKLGNGYTAGTIFSNGYVTTLGAYQRVYNIGGNNDIAISKFNSDGSQLIYGTYLGGNSNETSNSLIVDDSLNLYVFGTTGSDNFPTTSNAYNTTKINSGSISTSVISFPSGTDIYVTKFNSSGTQLLGSTFYGGSQSEGVNNSNFTQLRYNYGDGHRGEIILDSIGNCYIGTCTFSNDLPNTINSSSGSLDGLVLKFTPNLDSLIWARYFGGSNLDAIYSIKIREDGKVLVGGGTTSFNDFPVSTNSYSDTAFAGNADGFISLISEDGTQIEKSTFIGTNSYDQVYFIESDRFNNVYALGQTRSFSFPIKNSQIADTSTGQFIIKLDPNLDSLQMSTTFGVVASTTNINISPTSFLVDQCLNMYVSGWGGSLSTANEGRKILPGNMPLSPNAISSTTDQQDFYFYVINRNVDSILYASYFGGNLSSDHVDGGTSRFDKRGVIYQSVCASCSYTNSTGTNASTLSDFPTTHLYFSTLKNVTIGGNNCNNALFKLDFEILPRAEIITDKQVICAPDFVNFKDSSKNAEELIWDFFGTKSKTQGLDTNIQFTVPGFYTVTQIARDTICNSFDSTFITIEVQANPITYNRIKDVFTCDTNQIDLTAITNQTASIFTWSSTPLFLDTLQIRTDSSLRVRPTALSKSYYLKIEEPGTQCIAIDTINVRYLPLHANSNVSADTVCEGSPVQFSSNFVNAQSFVWDFGNGNLDSTNRAPNMSFNNPGDYQISVVIENQLCLGTDSNFFNLNVQANNLTISTIPDTTYCGTDSILFTINSLGTANDFIWSNNSNYSDTLNNFPTDSSLIINSNTNQNFYKKVTDKYCELTSQVFVKYINYKIDLASIPDTVCAPFDLQLNSTQIGVSSFNFDFGNGQNSSSNTNPITNYMAAGQYFIQLIGENPQCPRSDTLRDTINVQPGVTVQPILDTLICFGDSITVIGNSNGTANQFIWATNPNFNNPINIITDSSFVSLPRSGGQNYYFKAINNFCTDSADVFIDAQEVDVFVDDYTSICLNDTINIAAQSLNGLSLNYNWNPRDSIISGSNSNQILVSPINSIYYLLNSQSSIGCTDFDSAFVEVNAPAFNDAEISTDFDSIFNGQQIILNTNRNGANLSYLWKPASGLSNTRIANPIANPSTTTNYSVTITDNNTGCEVVAFRLIHVFEINCGEPEIFIPTAFTPNNDLINDKFYVRGEFIESIELEIYNRWGELVFETNDSNIGWDGNFKNEPAIAEVYSYHLTLVCVDGQEFFKKGNITLIR